MMVKMYKQLIQQYASKLKLHIDESQLTLLSHYCESIESESVIKGFTKIQDPNNIANRHIGESLFLQECINKYPHSAQSKLIANVLSDTYPELRFQYQKEADDISDSRNIGRAHYKSDSLFILIYTVLKHRFYHLVKDGKFCD